MSTVYPNDNCTVQTEGEAEINLLRKGYMYAYKTDQDAEFTVNATEGIYEQKNTSGESAEIQVAAIAKNGTQTIIEGTLSSKREITIETVTAQESGSAEDQVVVSTNDSEGEISLSQYDNQDREMEVEAEIVPVSVNDCEVSLSTTTYTYSGEAKEPKVTVTEAGKILVKDIDNTVSYKNNKAVGKASAVITGIGDYTGTKEINFTINPKNVTSVKAMPYNYNTNKLTWIKSGSATGYEIYRSISKTGTFSKIATIKTNSSQNYLSTKLTTGKNYYYKIRSYKTVNGKNYYSGYTNAIGAKLIPGKPVWNSLKNESVNKAKLQWKRVNGGTGYELYRSTKKMSGYKKIKTIKKGITTSYVDAKLTRGRTYYYKIRVYRIVNGKKIYGKYVNVKPLALTNN